MPRLAIALIAFAFLAAAARTQDGYEPKPLPAAAEGYTKARFDRDCTSFWTGLLLQECEAREGFKEQWRPHLEAMLGSFAEWWHVLRLSPDNIERMWTARRQLDELGCNDPIVEWAAAYGDLGEERNQAAAAWMREQAPKLRGQLKVPALRFLLEHTCWEIADRIRDWPTLNEAATAAYARLGEAVAGGAFGPGKERILLWVLGRSSLNRASALPQLEALEKAAGKPHYALLVCRAQIEKELAWAARGHGTAASIGDKERQRFLKHVESALAAATDAYELCPQHPEAPEAIIQNVGVVGGSDGLRIWFDRAVAAQFDSMRAYEGYAHYLQPRWGGSARALQAFAEECLATGRFDTRVPAMYVQAIQYLTLDAKEPLSVWKRTKVQERLEQMAKGYAAAAKNESQRIAAGTHHIVRLALAGKVEEAAVEYERQQQQLDTTALAYYDLPDGWLMKAVRPHMLKYVPVAIRATNLFAGHEKAAYAGLADSKPFSAHSRASTDSEARLRTAKWLDRSFVAAYDRVGAHDARWDEDARALLARIGELFRNTTTDATRELAKKVLDAECTDPLVLYVATRAREAEDPAARRMRRMTKADAEIDKAYSPAFQWFAKQHLADVTRQAGRWDIAGSLMPDLRDRIARSAADPIFAGADRCHFIPCALGATQWVLEGTSWMSDDTVAAMAKVEGADPWIVHVSTGLHYARTARYVQSTDADHERQLRTAKEHLEKAYALHPELPEPAVGMIVVAAMLGEAAGSTPRAWLDRALAAQIDCQPALSVFVDTLRPGFGGSVPAMYRFALECLDSGRFDSELPLWYARTLQRIAEEVDYPRAAWAATGVGKHLDRMWNGYLAKGQTDHAPHYFHSGRCLTAWAGGRYADAVQAYKAAGEKLDGTWLELVGAKDLDLIEIDLKAAARPPRK